MLTTLFGHGPGLAWWQECARAVLIASYGLLLVRLSGKRSFSGWSAIDVVVSIIVGSSLSRALTGSAALFGTMAAMAVVILLHGLLGRTCAAWPRASAIFEGSAVILGENGTADPARLARHSISRADLEEALRGAQLSSVEQTSRITLEPSGKITVLKS